jgi:outer membrane protein, heavy metal efflux system
MNVDRHSIRSLFVLVLILACAGCESYEPQPLDPEGIVGSVDHARRHPDVAKNSRANTDQTGSKPARLTLNQAAGWMLTHGPDVKVAVSAYRTALARARISTPLPNPGLQVGPQYGFGPDVVQNRVVPFGSLSISIPLGSRLGDADALNQARAEVLRVDGVARHRELYLELRRRFVELAVAREIEGSRSELARAAAQSVASARRLVEAGQATALDVALFELERGRADARLLEARGLSAQAKAQLASLIGVHADSLGEVAVAALPSLPRLQLPLGELRSRLIANHTGLARIRARHEEAESSLRLEISKQYPDLQIGTSASGEANETTTFLGLSLGIELPILDRNQQAIAQAEQYREELKSRYEAEANRALAELERAQIAVQLATSRRRALDESVLPQARKSIELARQSLSAGSGDALRLLDAERSYREVVLESLDAQLAERKAWVDLELSVGRPLVPFPSESPIEPPAGLEPINAQDEEAAPSGEGEYR